jgi:hypothetical protein
MHIYKNTYKQIFIYLYTYNFPIADFVECQGSPCCTCSNVPKGTSAILNSLTSSGSIRFSVNSRYFKSSHGFGRSKCSACPLACTPRSVRLAPVTLIGVLNLELSCFPMIAWTVLMVIEDLCSCQPLKELPSYMTLDTYLILLLLERCSSPVIILRAFNRFFATILETFLILLLVVRTWSPVRHKTKYNRYRWCIRNLYLHKCSMNIEGA